MSHVSYDLHYQPCPVGCTATLGLDGGDVTLTLSEFPALAITASPRWSADPLSSAASLLATPLVNAITAFLGAFAGNVINGKRFTIASVPPLSYTAEGVQVTLKPTQLVSAAFAGMLKISGDFTLS